MSEKKVEDESNYNSENYRDHYRKVKIANVFFALFSDNTNAVIWLVEFESRIFGIFLTI